MKCDQLSVLEKQQGFSLLELLTVLLISAILITLSVAINKTFVSTHRSIAAMNTLMTALYHARSEAMSRAEKIVFCKSVDKKTCSGEWSNGQITLSETGEVLHIFSAVPSVDKLIWSSSLGKNDKLEWLATGYTNGQRGTFYYCAMKAGVAASRSVVVLNTGRLYAAEMTVADFEKYCK